MPDVVPSLQQRVRDQARDEVAQHALRLFLAKGFDATTVDEICASAGLGRRTFFRYFQGKEGVVGTLFEDLGVEGSLIFLQRPAQEDVWSALRHCMDPFEAWTTEDPASALELVRLVEENTSLRAGYLTRVDAWRAGLAAVVNARAGLDDESALYGAVVAAAAMGAFLAGVRAWLAGGGIVAVGEFFDEAFAVLAPQPR